MVASPAHAQLFGEVAKLTASDAAAEDDLGFSVAIDGDTIVVGATGDDGPAGADQGAAYVFVREGTTWSEQQKLTASDAASEDSIGYSVAVDGDTVVVAHPHNEPAGALSGSVYVFVRDGKTWTQQQELTASDTQADDRFGISVAVGDDTVVVGALYSDGPAGARQGAAYVFVRTGASWVEQQKLTASDASADDHLGVDVAVDGETVVAGASGDNGPGGGSVGSAYVFVRTGTAWTQQQKLTASDAYDNDVFGSCVSIDGNTVVVGAPFDDGPAGHWQGSAYVFVRDGTTWTQQQKLTASDGAINDFFGHDVSVNGDTAIIGPWVEDGPAGIDRGSAYVFVCTGTIWYQLQKLTASDPGESDYFGHSVAIDGDTVVAGAPGDSGPAGNDQGSAYAFVAGARCPSDVDGDADVGLADLELVLAEWGLCPPECGADIDGDEVVGVKDLLYVLAGWGPCP